MTAFILKLAGAGTLGLSPARDACTHTGMPVQVLAALLTTQLPADTLCRGSRRWPKTLGSGHTHGRIWMEFLVSSFGLPQQAVTEIWGVIQLMKISLSLFLSLCL